MDYQFVRKLLKDVAEVNKSMIFETLQNAGIEVLILHKDGYKSIVTAGDWQGTELYVSAADLDYAKKLMAEQGMEEFICDALESLEKKHLSEVELAEEEFYKKHRQNQMMGWMVILLVVVFLIFQFVNG